ncbi:PQQ-binding-like beta-propeller repeat protein [bacterium]|nr:PQQ-binding-like beta-propeller repeat protein [bacterium]
MKLSSSKLTIFLIVFLLSVPLAFADVPLFRNNPQRTGESDFAGPQTTILKWTYYTGAYITASPAVDSSGNLYFGNHDGIFYSLSPVGEFNWSYNTGDIIVSSPALDNDGSVYFGGLDKKFYALNSDGTLKWSYETQGTIYSSPNLTSEAILVGSDDNKLYALDKSGILKWSYQTGSWISSSPSVDTKGVIYFGSYDGKLYALNPDGSLKWIYDTKTYLYSSPSINENGAVYIGGYNGKLYAVKEGTLLWSYQTGSIIYSSPAISSKSGKVYFGSNDTKVYSLTSDGKLAWSYSVRTEPLKNQNFSSSPVIDKNENIYIGSYNKYLYSLNTLGVLRWSYASGLGIIASPVIAQDGVLYIASLDRKIHAITDIGDERFLLGFGEGEPTILNPIVQSVPDGYYKKMTEEGKFSANPNDINDPEYGKILTDRLSRGRLSYNDDYNTLERYTFMQAPPKPTALDEAMKLLHFDIETFQQDTWYLPARPYVLDITNTVMDNPLKTLDYAHEQVSIIHDPKATGYDLVKDGTDLLDLDAEEINFTHSMTENPLVDAIGEIYQDAGTPLSAAQKEDLKVSTDALPLLLKKVAAFLVYACKEAAVKRDLSLAPLSLSDRVYLNSNLATQDGNYSGRVLDILNKCENIDRAKLSEGAMVIASALDNIGSVMNNSTLLSTENPNRYFPFETTDVTGDLLFYYPTPLGSIIIGGPDKTVYNASLDSLLDASKVPLLIVDIGGDDEYYNRAGATFDLKNSVSLLVDIAGNDSYNTGENFAQGTGKLGIGYLVDFSGNDRYTGKSFSQGSGYIGVGVLRDIGGDDIYEGTFDSQAAGVIGIGILSDEKGDDEYYADTGSQSFAFCLGAAILKESEGDDYYYAGGGSSAPYDQEPGLERYTSQAQGASFGIRLYYSNEPHASGGAAIFSDNYGNDIYVGDFYSQGNAYWLSTAMLIDSHGDDIYFSRQYSQGAGIHLAVGLLLDESGNDKYITRAVSQGCGHDIAAGLLVDNGGDDVYITQDLSQGGGNALALSLLSDASGNDQYFAEPTHSSQGYGDFREDVGSIGIILDGSGLDYYTEPKYDDNRHWTKSSYGVGIDSESEDTGVK